jgi:hypothetical protein
LVFIGQASNIKYLYKVVGEQSVIKRGRQLADFLDNLIESGRNKKKEEENSLITFPVISGGITQDEVV